MQHTDEQTHLLVAFDGATRVIPLSNAPVLGVISQGESLVVTADTPSYTLRAVDGRSEVLRVAIESAETPVVENAQPQAAVDIPPVFEVTQSGHATERYGRRGQFIWASVEAPVGVIEIIKERFASVFQIWLRGVRIDQPQDEHTRGFEWKENVVDDQLPEPVAMVQIRSIIIKDEYQAMGIGLALYKWLAQKAADQEIAIGNNSTKNPNMLRIYEQILEPGSERIYIQLEDRAWSEPMSFVEFRLQMNEYLDEEGLFTAFVHIRGTPKTDIAERSQEREVPHPAPFRPTQRARAEFEDRMRREGRSGSFTYLFTLDGELEHMEDDGLSLTENERDILEEILAHSGYLINAPPEVSSVEVTADFNRTEGEIAAVEESSLIIHLYLIQKLDEFADLFGAERIDFLLFLGRVVIDGHEAFHLTDIDQFRVTDEEEVRARTIEYIKNRNLNLSPLSAKFLRIQITALKQKHLLLKTYLRLSTTELGRQRKEKFSTASSWTLLRE